MPKVLNIYDVRSGKESIDNAVYINRGTPWGNPYIISIDGDRDRVCDAYMEWLARWIEYKEEVKIQVGARVYSNKWVVENLSLLTGKNVICWCAPARCHGDTLIKLVNT